MKAARSAVDVLNGIEDDIRIVVSLTEGLRIIGAGNVDETIPNAVVYEMARLANDAAERIETAYRATVHGRAP